MSEYRSADEVISELDASKIHRRQFFLPEEGNTPFDWDDAVLACFPDGLAEAWGNIPIRAHIPLEKKIAEAARIPVENVETVEQYLARGGVIEVIPYGGDEKFFPEYVS